MSLTYRIAVVIFALEAVMMSFVIYMTVSRSQHLTQAQYQVNEKVMLNLLGDLSRVALFSHEFEELQNYLEKISEDPRIITIRIVDRRNLIVASSMVNEIGSISPILSNDSNRYWRTREIRNSSSSLGNIAVNFSNKSFVAAKNEVISIGVRIALVGMSIIAVVGVLTGYLLTRRLRKLSYVAQRIKEGDFTKKTNLSGADEVAVLGQAFDGMIESLKTTIDKLHHGETELRQARDELEQRVVERTSELEIANEELEYLATHDPLTGLPNRSLLLVRIDQAMNQAKSSGGSFAMMMMDLDLFKDINDSLGHSVGDQLLVQVSKRIAALLRKSDTVARLGGDEFALVLAAVNLDQARVLARKISECLTCTFVIDNFKINIGSSLGIAMYPEHAANSSELVKYADIAMYSAKRTNLNMAVYDPQENKCSETTVSLDARLRTAIENNDLMLYYQPKYDFKTREMVGAEALIRWQQENRVVYPDEFIPYAEKTALITELTEWVLESVLRQQALWRSNGERAKISVNISARDLENPSLLDFITNGLQRWQVPAEDLILEITETSVMRNPERALAVLKQLDKMGLGISIDDFGIGYSSLSYLKKLPVDEIKIDRSFVTDIPTDADSLVIVRSIIDLAANLGIKVTAEGVETQEVWEILASLGCNLGQGYFTARPMSCEEFSSQISYGGYCSTA